MATNYDVIVIGAGAMGSATAYHLAKQGQRVLLLEQFEIDHQKGSSYGLSRIIRYAYDHPLYVEMMKTAYPMWAAFEAETGETFYTRTGGLDFGKAGTPGLHAVIDCLKQGGIDHEVLTAAEGRARFPQFRFDDDMEILYQADAGVLSASKAVRAHVSRAEAYGAVIKPHTTVTRITPQAGGVEVATPDAVYAAGHLVITAGSWLRSLIQTLGMDAPLKPERCQEIYFETANPALYGTDRFPAFIAHLDGDYGHMPYGIASHQDSGLKVSLHGGQSVDHPSQIDYTPDAAMVERVRRFTDRYLPDVGAHRSSRVCLYTMTPDGHWVIDTHPQHPNIVFAGGCSGHAFKFQPLLGKILADLALTGRADFDLSLFSVQRFANTTPSA